MLPGSECSDITDKESRDAPLRDLHNGIIFILSICNFSKRSNGEDREMQLQKERFCVCIKCCVLIQMIQYSQYVVVSGNGMCHNRWTPRSVGESMPVGGG
jgi:hypothetical protein